jgi:glucose/arabinose dehydrogenase
MRNRVACVLAVLSITAAVSCSDDNPFAPIVGDVPISVIGPSLLGAPMSIGIETVATGLTSPVLLVHSPGSRSRRFVVDQIGLIRVLDASGALLPQPFLDLRARITPLIPAYDERGLLGLAFHPDYARNGRFFVYYTAPLRAGGPVGFNHTGVISEFRATGTDPVTADPASERVILRVDHPQGNHNGGTIAFGPDDGYLYISIGDGGNRDDEGLGHVDDWYADNAGGNAQDITQNLLGNILRIDVDGAQPYEVPGDNPFVGRAGLDEIWAYGFRNPYRFAFDPRANHALLVGDAGQELWEEVSVVVRGGNYGWNVKEGTHCFDAENPTVAPSTCPTADPTTGEVLRSPVIEFANTKNGGLSLTVVGGNVYRGSRVPALRGLYVFGGATSSFTLPEGRLFVATPQRTGLWPMQELLINGTDRLNHVVKGFGQDIDGEVYVLASQVLGPAGTTGKVFRLARPGS